LGDIEGSVRRVMVVLKTESVTGLGLVKGAKGGDAGQEVQGISYAL
jgi:Cu/Ag efflux pump CusA